MKEDLVEFGELMRVLGYEDERSAKKWCKQNNVPMLKIGSKKYILSQYLTQYIDNQLVIFVKANSLSPKILIKKVENKNTEIGIAKENETTENQHSEATRKFLSKIKSI